VVMVEWCAPSLNPCSVSTLVVMVDADQPWQHSPPLAHFA